MKFSKWFHVLLAGAFLVVTLACSRKEEAATSESVSQRTNAAPQERPVAAHTQEPAGGAGSLPEGHPPIGEPGAAPGAADVAAGEGASQAPSQLTWSAPAGWKDEPPTSSMRKAQYRIPAVKGDAEDAECAVFYFGTGQGGSAQANAKRWVDQFSQPDGSSSQSRSTIEVRSINGNQVMFVRVAGIYNPMAMPGTAQAGPKPGYAMIGAIVSTPDAPWFFKMTGPQKTVEASKPALESLISSIRIGT